MQNPLSSTPPLISTSRMIDVNEAERREILQSIDVAIRRNEFIKQRPQAFDPMKFVSFVGYETRGSPIPYEQLFGKKPQ